MRFLLKGALLLSLIGCGTPPKSLAPPPPATWSPSPRAIIIATGPIKDQGNKIEIDLKNPPQMTTALEVLRPLRQLYQHGYTAIFRARLKLPDQQILNLLVLYTGESATPKARTQLLHRLSQLRKTFSPNQMVMAIGDPGITRDAEEKNHFIERMIQPDWLVTHTWATYGKSKSWPLSSQILFSKDFFDGTNGWKVQPASFRSPEIGTVVADIVPVND